MEWIVKFINKYFGVAAIIGALGFLAKYLIQRTIDSYFNKKLEKHKQELAVITENAKYDIHKKLFDFEAYASKKHSVYPELYQILFEYWSEFMDFRYKIESDILSDILFKQNGLEGDTLEVGDALVLRFHEEQSLIRGKALKAHEYFYKNELYLSKSTVIAYTEALDALEELDKKILNSFVENVYTKDLRDPLINLIDVDEKYFEKAKDKIQILKETIYKELSYTHSEGSEQKEEALS